MKCHNALMELSIPAIASRIPTEGDAYELLEEWRWHGHPACPHCGADDPYFLNPADGVRMSNRGKPTERRLWKCRKCREKFSVLTGTVMHGTKISIRTWVFVIFELCASKNGIAAREIERRYNLSPKSAWFMLHRIREAMRADAFAGLLSGDIVADEAWIGGDPKNRHANDPRGKSKRGRGSLKTPVVSLIEASSGQIRSKVVADVSGKTLKAVISEYVDMPVSVLHTDSNMGYGFPAEKMAGHHRVDHSRGQYVTEKSKGTNKAENYFSQLKRSIDGTHHHVSKEHLGRYLAEFDFRHSSHRMTDTQRVDKLMRMVAGRRLMYSDSPAMAL